MRRALLFSALLVAASSALAQYAPLRVAVIHVPDDTYLPVACTSGGSPNIVTDDDGASYTCVAGVYVVLPGSMSGTGTADATARWISSSVLGTGALTDNGQQVSVIGAPLGVPYRLAVGYDGTKYLKISTDSGNRTTLEAIGSTPKIDLATGEVRIINDATEKLSVRRAAVSTQGLGLGVASSGTTWTVTTDNGTCNGFTVVPSASWAGGTIFRVLNYLGTPIVSVNVDGTLTVANAASFGGTVAAPTLVSQYDTNNKATVTTSSAGDTTITPKVGTPSSSTKLLTIQPDSGTGVLTNGASVFQVNDLAARQRFWIGRYASNAAATALRFGFDSSNYMQFTAGTAAGSEGTFSVVGLTGLTFSPTVSFSLAPKLTAEGPIIGTGSDADLTLETNNQGATDPTVTYNAAVSGYKPARTRAFHNQALALDEAPVGAASGIFWPITAPETSVIFSGNSAATFNGYTDATHCVGYNTDCQTTRFNTATYAMADNWEFSYDSSATAGRQSWIEHNWNWVSASGAGWRPHYFYFDTTANSNEGAAHWFFKANNLAENMSLSLDWPWTAVNMINGTDTSYQTAGLSNFLRVNNFDTGGSQWGTMTSVIFDQNTAGGPAANLSSREGAAYLAHLDFSPASSLSGYIAGYLVDTPTAPGTSATVTETYGVRLYDLRYDRTGMLGGDVIKVDSQTVTDGNEGNVNVAGAGYNHGHYKIGSTHLWENGAGQIRVKGSTPTSDGDGNVLVSGTGSTAHGAVLWGVKTATNASFDTGTEVCSSSGLTCSTTFDVWGTGIACGTAHTLYDGWAALCY